MQAKILPCAHARSGSPENNILPQQPRCLHIPNRAFSCSGREHPDVPRPGHHVPIIEQDGIVDQCHSLGK
jgi:hypothetical protein